MQRPEKYITSKIMHIILFEDQSSTHLVPAAIARPEFSLTVGSYRLIDLAHRFAGNVEVIVRPYLRELVKLDYPNLWNGKLEKRDATILVLNARTVPHIDTFNTLKDIVAQGVSGVVQTPSGIACALFNGENPLPDGVIGASQLTGIIADTQLPPLNVSIPMFEYAHDIIRHQLRITNDNLNDRLRHGSFQEIADGVFSADGQPLGQHCVVDTSDGPVIFDKDVKVGPFCYFRGPVYAGPNARINEYASLKDAVTVGNTVKVGGEVEGAIIESYSNKQHHGFLGHSYLGSWINLGAGTSNSDLKNTYGEVIMDYNRSKVKTGMQFVGSIIGDYSKTAINTSVFTGKTIGACSMLYGFITTNVPSFVNYARTFGQVTEVGIDTLVQTQARMFSRRNVEQRPCDIQLLRDIYEMTRHERQLANEPLQL
jgi:glucose-1-phosphate thymidylyltransferase